MAWFCWVCYVWVGLCSCLFLILVLFSFSYRVHVNLVCVVLFGGCSVIVLSRAWPNGSGFY